MVRHAEGADAWVNVSAEQPCYNSTGESSVHIELFLDKGPDMWGWLQNGTGRTLDD